MRDFSKRIRRGQFLLHALDFILAPPLELVLAGDFENNATQSMLTEINQRFMPSKVLVFKDTTKTDATLIELVPFLANQKAIEGKPHSTPAATRLVTNRELKYRK